MNDPAALGAKRRDLALFVFVVGFWLAAAGGVYYGSRFSSAAAVFFGFALILSFCVLSGVVGIWILVRCIRLRVHRSPLLLLSAIILATLPWTLQYGLFSIDWVRFQKDRTYYEEIVSSAGSSKVQFFLIGEKLDWPE
jgi:hypothetical protein